MLVTTPGLVGHVHPMLPLARAIGERGHEVRWAVPRVGVESVEAAGFRAIPTGPVAPIEPNAVRARFPELDGLAASAVPDVLFAKLFGAISTPAMLDDLEPVALAWRPDVVVSDAAAFAGHLIAAQLGVPSVTKGFGPLLPAARVRRAGDEVAELWRERGLEPRPYGGAYDHLYIDIYPPTLRRAAPELGPRLSMRPESEDWHVAGPSGADDADGDDPRARAPLPEGRSEAPLVYVTMGTVFHDGPLAVVVDAVSTLDVRVLATVGPAGDPSVLGPQPPHVRVERYVPQSRVLPVCDVVVSHAGSGTTLASGGLGLPHLCLPQGADQFLNADAIAAAGAGLSLSPSDQTTDLIRTSVERLLADPSFRTAAARVAADISAMPEPTLVADALEDLTRSGTWRT